MCSNAEALYGNATKKYNFFLFNISLKNGCDYHAIVYIFNTKANIFPVLNR